MRCIGYNDNKPYAIRIEKDNDGLVEAIKACVMPSSICLITDSHVADYYLEEVTAKLSEIAPVVAHVFEAGEHSKHLETVTAIYDTLLAMKMDRSGLIVALGGGVVGDLAGFVASSYMRGIPFVQLPTTVVAQNDSSIGGKVGVDYLEHKNMVGAFYNPLLVYTNIQTLQTLPQREFFGGMSEVIKHGIIKDVALYDYLVANREKILTKDDATLMDMTYQSALVKSKVVEGDPKESGERKILNFGHTIGHAIETLSHFSLSHGECVAYGMIMAAYISYERQYISKEVLKDIEGVCLGYGLLDVFPDFDHQEVIRQMTYDKKKAHGKIAFVLMKAIGEVCIVKDVTDQEVINALSYMAQVAK